MKVTCTFTDLFRRQSSGVTETTAVRNAGVKASAFLGPALVLMAAYTPVARAQGNGAKTQPPPPAPNYATVQPGAQAPIIPGTQAIQGTGLPNLSVTGNMPVPNLAVGVTTKNGSGNCVSGYYVQAVRMAYTVHNKCTDAIVPGFQAVPISNLFANTGNGCSTVVDYSVPVTYDRKYDRWIFSAAPLETSPLSWCIAVSQTSDPTGGYYTYAIPIPNLVSQSSATVHLRGPKTVIWPTGYFMTFQTFSVTSAGDDGPFTGAEVCAMDRAAAAAGTTPAIECSQLPASAGWVATADQDGGTEPAGAEYIVGLGSNKLTLWRFAPNFVSPSASDLTGPSSIAVSAFTQACDCIPQPGTSQPLSSWGYSPMYRLVYRNVGGVNYLTVNHAVDPGHSNKEPLSGIRWYLMTMASGTAIPVVAQQGTYSPDSVSRWMGSMALDKCGDVGIGFNVSNSTTVYPGIRFAGRTPSDSANTLESEIHLLDGAHSEIGSDQWGASSDLRVDPSDDKTFYYTTEYLAFSGNTNWSTAIAKIRFGTCQ